MAARLDRNVPIILVPDADRARRALVLSLPLGGRAARVAELRRRVRAGYYASDAMMDAVARRLLHTGDL
jgi:hypothetical protein